MVGSLLTNSAQSLLPGGVFLVGESCQLLVGEANTQGLDDISHMQQVLGTWQVEGPVWKFSGDLHAVIAHACPAGAQIAHCVWLFFQHLIYLWPNMILELHGMSSLSMLHFLQVAVCRFG